MDDTFQDDCSQGPQGSLEDVLMELGKEQMEDKIYPAWWQRLSIDSPITMQGFREEPEEGEHHLPKQGAKFLKLLQASHWICQNICSGLPE